jgi:hypothetical protein
MALFFAVVIPVLIMLGVTILARTVERRHWNNGFCRRSGYPWRAFDMDSSGATGYTDNHGNYFWASWGVDKDGPGEWSRD